MAIGPVDDSVKVEERRRRREQAAYPEWAARNRQDAAETLYPGFHPGYANSGHDLQRRAVPVVDHLHPKAIRPPRELDRDVLGAAMLVSVGQRLLDHAEHGALDGERHLIDGAHDIKGDHGARAPLEAVHELVQGRLEPFGRQLRRMQQVRQRPDLTMGFHQRFAHVRQGLVGRPSFGQRVQTQLHGDEMLGGRVVQFERDPLALFLLDVQQALRQGRHLSFGGHLLRHVDAAAEISGERAGAIEGLPVVEDLPVHAVRTPQAVRHREALPRLERAQIDLQATIQVLGVDALGPALPELLLRGAADKVEPRLVEPVAKRIGSGPPDHHRRVVGQLLEEAFPLVAHRMKTIAHAALLLSRLVGGSRSAPDWPHILDNTVTTIPHGP
jgi:hypothetical protein